MKTFSVDIVMVITCLASYKGLQTSSAVWSKAGVASLLSTICASHTAMLGKSSKPG